MDITWIVVAGAFLGFVLRASMGPFTGAIMTAAAVDLVVVAHQAGGDSDV